jgi:hypothetical protein
VRVAQTCLPAYGTDVRGVEITRLTPTDYAERPLAGPPLAAAGNRGWNSQGMHHLAIAPTVDGRWLAATDGWRMEAAS